MSDQVGDGAGEDEEGEAGDHSHRHSPPHDEAAGVQVVEVPKEEPLDVSPERPGECLTVPFRPYNLEIEMRIGAQMRRTVILHLKPNLNTSKLNIEMQIEMKL